MGDRIHVFFSLQKALYSLSAIMKLKASKKSFQKKFKSAESAQGHLTLTAVKASAGPVISQEEPWCLPCAFPAGSQEPHPAGITDHCLHSCQDAVGSGDCQQRPCYERPAPSGYSAESAGSGTPVLPKILLLGRLEDRRR